MKRNIRFNWLYSTEWIFISRTPSERWLSKIWTRERYPWRKHHHQSQVTKGMFFFPITGGMAKFSVALTLQRRAGYYILQVYIPASFLVILSWLSFLMEATNIADRLTLEITMILSTVFLLDGINDSVTRVSYAKASDWYVITSFGFIFFALLETMFVYRLSLSEKKSGKVCSEKQSGVEVCIDKEETLVPKVHSSVITGKNLH